MTLTPVEEILIAGVVSFAGVAFLFWLLAEVAKVASEAFESEYRSSP